jgi:hypothetical protein
VLDGRVYNYPKPGAQEVGGQQEADKALQAGQEAAKVRNKCKFIRECTRES